MKYHFLCQHLQKSSITFSWAFKKKELMETDFWNTAAFALCLAVLQLAACVTFQFQSFGDVSFWNSLLACKGCIISLQKTSYLLLCTVWNKLCEMDLLRDFKRKNESGCHFAVVLLMHKTKSRSDSYSYIILWGRKKYTFSFLEWKNTAPSIVTVALGISWPSCQSKCWVFCLG